MSKIVGQVKDSNGRSVMVITESERTIALNDDLRRLVIGMRNQLQRTYPNEFEREVARTLVVKELGR